MVMFDPDELNRTLRAKAEAGQPVTIEDINDILLRIAEQAASGCMECMTASGASAEETQTRLRTYRLQLDQWRVGALANITRIVQESYAAHDPPVLH